MTAPDNPQLLIRAQDGPIPHGPELQDRLQRFTVPILRFGESSPYPDYVGSGVLLKICDLRFVLTAAHCVRGDFALTALGIRDIPHRFEFKPASQNFVISAARGDFGYFQVSSEQGGTIEAGNRVFLNEKSVEVLSVAEHADSRDFYALAGYPKDMYRHKNGSTGSSLLVYSTTMAGGRHAPDSTLDPGADTRREIFMWIPQQENVDTLKDKCTPAALGDFHGASGGGWWATKLNRPEWRATNVKLIGTHVGSNPQATDSDDGLRHKFSRVSLIGNHLALIARDLPALRSHIYATWPAVEAYGIDP